MRSQPPRREGADGDADARGAARQVIERGCDAARELGINVSIAVVDAGGHLVAFGRMDGIAFMTVDVAIAKAWTAASVKILTSILHSLVADDLAFLVGSAVATGGRFLATAGGAPVKIGADVVGGVGVSGGSAEQDGQVAEAAAATP